MYSNSINDATRSVTVLFGTARSSFALSLNDPIAQQRYTQLCYSIGSPYGIETPLVVLDQIHSTQGHHITTPLLQHYQPRTLIGDYAITTLPFVPLGVLTADCVPLFIYDPHHAAIAAVHVGWRGALNNIIPLVLQHMHVLYRSEPGSLRVWIGPSARICCYEIAEPVLGMLQERSTTYPRIRLYEGRWYADFAAYSVQTLREAGIAHKSITISPTCTICSLDYYSHRREPQSRMRQISYIMLKNTDITGTYS